MRMWEHNQGEVQEYWVNPLNVLHISEFSRFEVVVTFVGGSALFLSPFTRSELENEAFYKELTEKGTLNAVLEQIPLKIR